MNDLNKALGDISSIRRQVARSTEFRGYGPATLAATGGIAVLAAGVQAVWLPEPGESHSRISGNLGLNRNSLGSFDRCRKRLRVHSECIQGWPTR